MTIKPSSVIFERTPRKCANFSLLVFRFVIGQRVYHLFGSLFKRGKFENRGIRFLCMSFGIPKGVPGEVISRSILAVWQENKSRFEEVCDLNGAIAIYSFG